ncbi:MFS transporter [Gammaproteobacteria bacterium]|nr:MFS transporter [Gammaproteobacteria bacterium]
MFSYFLSELLRNINSVVAPRIQSDMNLSSGEMGLITSVFLLAVAMMQLFSGIFLDRYGNKKTVSFFLVIASLGAFLFSLGDLKYLYAGRFLLGIGVAACWTAAFNVNNILWDKNSLPTANGLIIGLAGIGAMVSTYPLQVFLNYVSWQDTFRHLSALILIVSAIILLTPSERKTKSDDTSTIRDNMRGYYRVITSDAFIAIGPLSIICQGVWLAYQGLWAGQWITKINGIDEKETSIILLALACSVIVGNITIGPFLSRFINHRSGLAHSICVICAIFVISQILVLINVFGDLFVWVVFGATVSGSILGYAYLSSEIDNQYSGRALSLLNLLATMAGFFIQYFVGYLEEVFAYEHGYKISLITLITIQVIAVIWAWIRSTEIANRKNIRY